MADRTSTPRRLIVVTEQMTSSHGTQMLASLVIDEACAAGFEVALFAPKYDPVRSAWTAFLNERNVEVFTSRFWRLTRWYLPHRILARRLWKFAKRFRPQLIWSPDNEPMTCCALECRPSDAPPLLVHDPGDGEIASGRYPKLWLSISDRVAGLSVHGERQLENARKFYSIGAPIKVVWPSSQWPEDREHPHPDLSVVRFGQFGRLDRNKSVATSILAIAALRTQGFAAELHIHGDGPERGYLELLCRQHALEDRVFFHGEYHWRDVGRRIRSVHVGLITSRHEGFGLVMLELLSRNRPVIAGDVGSAKEVLERMGGGWVVTAHDLVALTEQMKTLCLEPRLIFEAGARGAEIWSAHFTPASMFRRYTAFWRECGVAI